MRLSINKVAGLTPQEQANLNTLIDVYNSHEASNMTKARYYEGHIKLSEVNLGIALPRGIKLAVNGAERTLTCWHRAPCSTDS